MRILFDFFPSWPNNHVMSTYLLVTTSDYHLETDFPLIYI